MSEFLCIWFIIFLSTILVSLAIDFSNNIRNSGIMIAIVSFSITILYTIFKGV